MKLMLVEDDQSLNNAITSYLLSRNIELDSYLNGLDALNALDGSYDLFIIDIYLPKISGLEILQQIRELYTSIPVIMISAVTEMHMIEKAYTLGCNDYLKKPFDVQELEFKINAFTKNLQENIQLVKNLYYSVNMQQLLHNGEIIQLTNYEQKFLSLLIKNTQRILPTEYIESIIWGLDSESAHLRQLVSRLRKKLPYDIIENHIGKGYILNRREDASS